jgi:hypothetical protein
MRNVGLPEIWPGPSQAVWMAAGSMASVSIFQHLSASVSICTCEGLHVVSSLTCMLSIACTAAQPFESASAEGHMWLSIGSTEIILLSTGSTRTSQTPMIPLPCGVCPSHTICSAARFWSGTMFLLFGCWRRCKAAFVSLMWKCDVRTPEILSKACPVAGRQFCHAASGSTMSAGA